MQSLLAMQSFTLANLHFSPLNANVCMFCFQYFFFLIFINVCALPCIRTLSNRCFDLPAICSLLFFGHKHSFWCGKFMWKRCNQPQSMRCNAMQYDFSLILFDFYRYCYCLMPFIFFFSFHRIFEMFSIRCNLSSALSLYLVCF